MLTLANHTLCMTHPYDFTPVLRALEASGIVLLPTDTLWGIACDATDPLAIEKMFSLSNRPRHKPFTLLVSSLDMLKDYVVKLHPRLETLLLFHTRPLTIIFNQAKNLPSNAVLDNGSAAIRLVQDDFCRTLINKFGKPLLCGSAKIDDAPTPTYFGEISSEVFTNVDFIVKHRQKDKNMGEKSVIARLSDSWNAELEFLRE